MHEERAGQIVRRVMKEVGREVPLELSSEVAPTAREVSRANATVIQAYASSPARKQLFRIEEELKKIGYPHSLKTVLGYGGIDEHPLPAAVRSGDVGPGRRPDGRQVPLDGDRRGEHRLLRRRRHVLRRRRHHRGRAARSTASRASRTCTSTCRCWASSPSAPAPAPTSASTRRPTASSSARIRPAARRARPSWRRATPRPPSTTPTCCSAS